MQLRRLARAETAMLKGLAILTIALHNFFHMTWPNAGENEFDFKLRRAETLADHLVEYPTEIANSLLSFFGHYGVQVFILLSGYGLALSMLSRPRPWGRFMLDRLSKLYPLLVAALLFFMGYRYATGKPVMDYSIATEFTYKLLFLHTLSPGSGLKVCGPWWFFGLIFQLYLVFPVVFKILQRWNWRGFAGICLAGYGWVFASQLWCQDVPHTMLLHNAPGHLPEFALGAALALNAGKRVSPWWLLPAAAALAGGNVTRWAFPFTFLGAAALAYWPWNAWLNLRERRQLAPTAAGRALERAGGLSMLVFATHGLMRQPFLDMQLPGAWGKILEAVFFIGASLAVAALLRPLYDLLCRLAASAAKGMEKLFAGRRTGNCISLGFKVLFVSIAIYATLSNAAVRTREILVADIDLASGAAAGQGWKVEVDSSGAAYLSVAPGDLGTTLLPLTELAGRPMAADIALELDYRAPAGATPPLMAAQTRDTWRPTGNAPKGTGERQQATLRTVMPCRLHWRNQPVRIMLWNDAKTQTDVYRARVTVRGVYPWFG